MPNPWLAIPLSDYEGHMGADNVQQLSALSSLFKRVLDMRRPESVAILGIAGGNGLEHVAHRGMTRVIGVDFHPDYLEEVRRRFPALPHLELYQVDLSEEVVDVPPVDLVHAALFFEHAGLGPALDNALSLVMPGGSISVVLQLPGHEQQHVTATPYPSMQTLAAGFSLIAVDHLRGLLETRGFGLLNEEQLPLPTGKALWLGVFSRGTTTDVKASGKSQRETAPGVATAVPETPPS